MNKYTTLLGIIFLCYCKPLFALNLWDNQLIADAACPIQDVRSTESEDGKYIGVRNYGCNYGGVNTVWTVSIPKSCEQGGCGLILDIHGATMNATLENNGTQLREFGWKASERGSPRDFIVVQPSFTDLFDDVLGLDLASVFGNAYLNELPSIEQFIDDAIEKFSIDTQRIHFYGFSRGTHTANEFYCNQQKRDLYASFVMHGETLKCDIQDKPLMVINGIYDFFTPNQQWRVIPQLIEKLDEEQYNKTTIHQDNDWTKRPLAWTWVAIFPIQQHQGQHQHLKFTKDNRWVETIQHGGISFPALGHCLPNQFANGFLTCFSNFDTGTKALDFFIAHPKNT